MVMQNTEWPIKAKLAGDEREKFFKKMEKEIVMGISSVLSYYRQYLVNRNLTLCHHSKGHHLDIYKKLEVKENRCPK